MKKIIAVAVVAGFMLFSFATGFAACSEFAAAKGGEKYHKADCGMVKNIKAGNEVCFKFPEEAKAAGYAACSVCKPAENTKVVASAESNKYHLPTCGIVKNIKKENLKEFNSPGEAAKAGFTSPCGICKPPKAA